MEALTTSSSDTLLTKIRNLASRSAANFFTFQGDGPTGSVGIKNTAQDNKHEIANYYWIIAKMLSFSKFPFGDTDQEKILYVISKVEIKRLIGVAKTDRTQEEEQFNHIDLLAVIT